MKFFLKALLLTGLCFGTSAKSQILVDTALVRTPSDLCLGPTLSLSKIEYNNEYDNTFTVKRKTLGLGLVYKLDADVGLLMQMGYTFDAEFEDSDLDNGTGYMAGMGVNFTMYRNRKVALIGYGLLNYVEDRYKEKYVHIDMHVTDIHMGGLVLVKASPRVGIFGGIDLVPYSEGSLDYHHGKLDISREEILNLKLGLEFNLPGAVIKPEVTLLGEETFSLMASFAM